MTLTALFLAAYFALLAWMLRRRARVVQGPWLFFLRAFFPNWKFFHAVGMAPRLYVRGRDRLGQWTRWHRVYPRVPRQLGHLLHNPAVNLALSHQNLVDHLASDINELPEGADIGQCVSYQLVCRLAHQAITGDHWGGTPMLALTPAQLPTGLDAFQFQVRMESPKTGAEAAAEAVADDAVQMLLSPELPTWH